MKKTIAIVLALTMALTLAACGGTADTPQVSSSPEQSQTTPPSPTADNGDTEPQFMFTPNPNLAGAADLSTDKEIYAPEEDVTITVTINSPELFPNGLQFGIYSSHINGHDYMRGTSIETAENIMRTVLAPAEADNYEVRVYSAYALEDCNEDSLVAVMAITVSEDSANGDASGGDTSTTPTPGTDVQDIPDDGTPAPSDDFEYLLFANAQIIEDAINNQNEYFCPTTDDYITYYDDIFFRPNEDEANDGVEGLRFGIVSFDENGDFASICEKFVFETPEVAELFVNTPNRFHDSQYGTLDWDGSTDVFCDRFPETEDYNSLPQDKTKSNLIAFNIDEYSPRIIIEISKP